MIEILQSGGRTTLQDTGRPGNRHMGIPASGAADKLSFALANWMAGNPWDAPALECVWGGQHVRFLQDRTIAIAGAEMAAQVNGRNIRNFTALSVKAGDILTFSRARQGSRAYLALAGGLYGENFMGSVSTYITAGIGGLDGTALKVGDRLEAGLDYEERQIIPPGYQPRISNHIVLRSRPAPEYNELSQASQRHIFISPYFAGSETNRMGARLRGDKLECVAKGSMTSGPMLPGTLQIPPGGGPILSMVDAHCTAGYPRAIQVIRADYWLMGQIGPGTQVSFQRSFEDDPAKILKRRNAFYGGLMAGFEF